MKTGRKQTFHRPGINILEELSAKLVKLNKELIELNGQLAEKNYALEKSEQARKNMFSNVTHDLRTPISAIKGAAEMLNGENLSRTEQADLTKVICSRADTLEKLINDLYLSTLLGQPEFVIKPQRLEIAPLLEEYYISMQISGKLENRDCSLAAEPSVFALIDAQYFIRVLDNLLSNAVRFTKAGDRISLGCFKEGNTAVIYLSDTGAGIPEDDIPFVFDQTFTGSKARTPGSEGSGLGLSISRTIVEKHGGEIICESVYGEGAKFTISLLSERTETNVLRD